MGFVMITGFPSSGKTKFSEALQLFLEEKGKKVYRIDDDLKSTFNRSIYESSNLEKEQRGFLRSEVQRIMAKDVIVILDSLNYIKGFRYELFCIAKLSQSSYCVAHCDVSETDALNFNSMRENDEKYLDETMNALFMRYEPPEGRNRWDRPLIMVTKSDGPSYEKPISDVYSVLFESAKKLTPNLSTTTTPLSAPDFMQILDKATQEIILAIVQHQKNGIIGDSIVVPNSETKVILNKVFTMPELSRLKRQFINYSKLQPPGNDLKVIADTFVVFINNTV